jgi:hypothetical protein
MNALAYSATVAVFGGGGLKVAMRCFGLLWAELDWGSFATPFAVVHVADYKW